MEKKKQITTPVIPSEIIIYDILTRVPTESLARFRCVCKNWSNLFFRDRSFINLHVQTFNKSTSSGLIHMNNDHCLVFIDPNDKNKKRLIPITVGYGSEEVDLKDSLNGLLILVCYSLEDFSPTYYVYNPITNFSIIIPNPNLNMDYSFRLCYDPITEKYKVVEVCASDPTVLKIRILTLKHGSEEKSHDDDYSWRNIVVPTPGCSVLDPPLRPIYLNGSLYWIIETWELIPDPDPLYPPSLVVEAGSVNPYILALDTTREFAYTIKLPEEVLPLSGDCRNLNEMDGLLCLSQYFSETHELKIWTLKKKDHDDEDEWKESFKINIRLGDAYSELYKGIRVLAILTVPKLKFIIMDSDRSSYFSYDMESEQLEIIHGPTKSYVYWHFNNIANG